MEEKQLNSVERKKGASRSCSEKKRSVCSLLAQRAPGTAQLIVPITHYYTHTHRHTRSIFPSQHLHQDYRPPDDQQQQQQQQQKQQQKLLLWNMLNSILKEKGRREMVIIVNMHAPCCSGAYKWLNNGGRGGGGGSDLPVGGTYLRGGGGGGGEGGRKGKVAWNCYSVICNRVPRPATALLQCANTCLRLR